MINVECKVLVIRFSNIPGSNVLVVKFEAFFFFLSKLSFVKIIVVFLV